MNGTLIQLNISPGGVPKLPIAEGMLTLEGIEGDAHHDLKHHGGPTRAICLYSEELYAVLAGMGEKTFLGQVGENFSTRGIDLQALKQGDQLRVGEVVIEITTVREPCSTLWKFSRTLPKKMKGQSGWYAKVVKEGVVRPGDVIEALREGTAG